VDVATNGRAVGVNNLLTVEHFLLDSHAGRPQGADADKVLENRVVARIRGREVPRQVLMCAAEELVRQ
jgi:hypothetical protein